MKPEAELVERSMGGSTRRKHPHKHYIHRSNWLRAAVLGANDGLVSVASLTIGVAGSSVDNRTLIIASVAGLVAGEARCERGAPWSRTRPRCLSPPLRCRVGRAELDRPQVR